MAKIWELSVWVKVDQSSLNKATNQVKTSFQQIWNEAEKNLDFRKAWTEKTIDWINKKLVEMRKELNNTEIGSKRFKELQKEVQNTEKKINKLSWDNGGGFKKLLWVFTWLFAWLKSLGFLWQSTNQAIAENSQYERLFLLLQNTNNATREQVQLLNYQAKALEEVWVVTAANVTQVQSQLATFDLSIQAIEKLTPAILDYVVAEKWASATTDDFKQATNGLAQALNGNFQSLTAVWFVLDEATKKQISNGTEMERANAIVEVLDSTYRGFNEALAQTDEWKIINLKNRFNMLRTEVGQKLLPVVLSLVDAWLLLMDVFKTNDERIAGYTKKIQDNENAQALLNKQLQDGKISQEEYENKMEQLKTKHDEFSEKLKNVWTDTISTWKNVLTKIQDFFSLYWDGIIEMIKDVWVVIFENIKFVTGIFWDLFAFIGKWTADTDWKMQWTALVFMRLVQWFAVWVKLIWTIFKTLVDIVTIAMWSILSISIANFKSLLQWWNILKTSVVWIFKTIWDVWILWAELIWLAFVGLAEWLVWVFKWIADNVAVAVKKATNLAIEWINRFVDLANKIKWVNITRLTWFDDVSWKKFDLWVGKNLETLKWKFSDFWNDVWWNFDGIWQSFSNIANNYKKSGEDILWVTKVVLSKTWDDWGEFTDFVIEWNKKIDNSLKNSAKNTEDSTKKSVFSLSDLKNGIEDVWDETDNTWWKTKKTEEKIKNAIDGIKKKYNEWEKSLKKVDEASEKFTENQIKYNQDIEDSLRKLWNELDDVTKKYEDQIDKIEQSASWDLAKRWVEISKDLLDIEEDIAKTKEDSLISEEEKQRNISELQEKINILQLRISENTEKTNESTRKNQQLQLQKLENQLQILQNEWVSVQNQEKLAELEEKRTELLREQAIIQENVSDDVLAEAQRVSWLSEAERIQEEKNAKIKAEQEKFEAEKTRIETLKKINETFLQVQSLNEKQLTKLIADERFARFSQEEQELILKLAREKVQLTQQKNDLILMQQEIANATINLSNNVTAIQMSNIQLLKDEYTSLINTINQAIATQKELERTNAWPWFANGWFTGSGGVNEVAWVVHKWEWVAPKWMVNSMKPLFDSLESQRSKWFANGGYTNTINKNQNNNITVNSQVDLRGFLDYAKWKL